MHPEIDLDDALLAANVRAWRARAGVPVRPVIKCDGYGWGAARVIEALDAECDAYCVADLEELSAARAFTRHPIVLLGRIATDDLHAALDLDGVPTIETLEEIESCVAWQEQRGRAARVRIGLLPAVGWSGVDLSALDALTLPLANAKFELEIWTHVTGSGLYDRQAGRLSQAVHLLRAMGVRVVGSDVCSTFPLAQNPAGGTNVRIGVGLFGATGGVAVEGVRCAMRVRAPVTRCDFVKKGMRVGYGAHELEQDGYVLTARCGYGDGLPKGLTAASDTLSVGMQYITRRSAGSVEPGTMLTLVDETTNVDQFASEAGTGTHEFVTALGNASQRMNAGNRNRRV